MPIGFRPRPLPPGPIDVSRWPSDEDYPVFPIGSKPKRLLICPASQSDPFLIPGHKYLFKVASGWQKYQIWSEIISYEIAKYIGISVPPCFCAIDSNSMDFGVLVEFFYGYPRENKSERLIHASDLLQRVGANKYDQKTGRPHYFRQNVAISRAFVGSEKSFEWWGTTFAFDALIGNTDRHPENWGFVINGAGDQRQTSFAPIFDNGTSLGYERTEASLSSLVGDNLTRYVLRGTHHCAWDASDRKGGLHFELCAKLAALDRHAGAAVKNVIQLNMAYVSDVLEWCCRFDSPTPFTANRAEFVLRLVDARRDQLVHAIGG